MSAKVPALVKLAKQALAENKCVVIGLQSTGEARTEEAVTKYVSFLCVMFYFSSMYFWDVLNLNVCFFLFVSSRVLNWMTLFQVLGNFC